MKNATNIQDWPSHRHIRSSAMPRSEDAIAMEDLLDVLHMRDELRRVLHREVARERQLDRNNPVDPARPWSDHSDLASKHHRLLDRVPHIHTLCPALPPHPMSI